MALQANELRVGNLVRIRGYRLCVKAISDMLYLGNNAASDFIHDNFEYSKVDAIELTPTILELCGFDKESEMDNGVKIYKLDISSKIKGANKNEILCMFNADDAACLNYVVDNGWGTNNFQYLHQLQNLYYILTGEELNINI